MDRSSQPFFLSLPICLGLALGCAKGADIAPGEIVILSEQPADAGRADAAPESGSAAPSSPPSGGSTPASGSSVNSNASVPEMAA
ncbi:MAG TPA: hypothetical protein VG963_07885, partial [Polyangiaceae bacterium]|nr:hypothetical protein [Polyangiaceae bacterium]